MKLQIALILLISLTPSGIPQTAAGLKPELVDQFGQLGCDALEAHSDSPAQKIKNTDGSRALVIAYATDRQLKLLVRRFRVILRHFELSEIEDRIDFQIAHGNTPGQTEFWIIPKGAAEPSVGGEKWVERAPNLTKPFIFDIEDEIGICSTFVPRKFAELLNANPGSRAHIVIKKGRSGGNLKGFADNWIPDLVSKYHLRRARIKVYYVRGDSALTYAELWVVPARKNR